MSQNFPFRSNIPTPVSLHSPPHPPHSRSRSVPFVELPECFLNPSSTSPPHNPTLDADYSSLDAEDPHISLGWFTSIHLMGFTPRKPNDPRFTAIAKIKSLTSQHGMQNIPLRDLILAATVFATLVQRHAKQVLPQPSIPHIPSSNTHPNLQIPSLDLPSSPNLQNLSATSKPLSPLSSHTSQHHQSHECRRMRRWSMPGPIERLRDDSYLELLTCSNTAIRQKLCTSTQNSSQLHFLPTARPEYVQLMYHMLRHAESIYGLPLNVPSAPRVSLMRLTDRAIICRRTGIAPSDLMHVQLTTEPFLPAHYVAVDRQIKAIVICIRGTANFVDILTDLAATSEPFYARCESSEICDDVVKGYGHAGTLRSARNIFNIIRKVTLRTIHQNAGFELLVTGHSLGAAIASVLTLIIRDDSAFPSATAVSIAPPPCMTLELAEQTASTTITLVNGSDIIPRLSVAVLVPFFSTVQYVSSLNLLSKTLLSLGLKKAVINWKELDKHNSKIIPEMKKQHEGKRLYIPGKVFQLVHRKETSMAETFKHLVFGKPDVEVVPVSRISFLQLPSRKRGMVLAHAPFKYKMKLLLALRSMGSRPAKKIAAGSVLRNLFGLPTISKFVADFYGRSSDLESLEGLLDKLKKDSSSLSR